MPVYSSIPGLRSHGLLAYCRRARSYDSGANAVNSFNQSTSPQVFAHSRLHAKMTDLELQSQETEALLKTSERPKKRALAIQIVALCGAAALAGAALASRAGSHDVAVTSLARTNETKRRRTEPRGSWPGPLRHRRVGN